MPRKPSLTGSSHATGGRGASKMRAILSGAAALVVTSTALLVATAAPSTAAAVKEPLILNSLNNCEFGADAIPGTGTPTSSFALVAPASKGKVNANVVLRDACPNATYNVFLIQSKGVVTGDPLDCQVQDATLTTDDTGEGTAQILNESLLPGVTDVHVFLFTFDGGFEQFDTGLVPVR